MAALPGTTASSPTGVTSPYATYTGAMPDAGAFGAYQASAQKAYTDALSQIQNQQSSFLTQQGLQGTKFDPSTGLVSGLAIQANDPMGVYQQLQAGLGQQQGAVDAGTTQAALGFGGALAQQAQHDQALSAQGQLANWAQGVQGAVQGAQAQQQQAYDQTQQGLAQQMLQDIQQAIASGAFNPASVQPGPTTTRTAPITSLRNWEPAWAKKKG